MKTIFRIAPLALGLFLGLVQSASAGVMLQEITLSSKLGSSPLPGSAARTPSVVTASVMVPTVVMAAVAVPAPVHFVPRESALAPVPMPAELPTALDEPADVPEPATVATLAAGLALMAAVTRRRRPAR